VRRAIFSADARRDIAQAWEYIAADNPAAANDLLTKVERALKRLCAVPMIGHTRRDVSDP
jgi:plasmid stabilization system protein ParE